MKFKVGQSKKTGHWQVWKVTDESVVLVSEWRGRSLAVAHANDLNEMINPRPATGLKVGGYTWHMPSGSVISG